jgi:hypothetical protein
MKLFYLILFIQTMLTWQHGAMISPIPRNAGGVDWNSGNVGAQYKNWVDDLGNPTIEPCGNAKWLAPGVIKEVLKEGSCFDIEVAISAQHMGYYEFRLCNNAISDKKQLTNCFLNGPLLKRANPLAFDKIATYKINTPPIWSQQQTTTRWRQEPEDGALTGATFKGYQIRKLKYCLPIGFSCDKCILQWYWQTLNSWQVEDATTLETTSGERYWNCADIQIVKLNGTAPPVGGTCADGIKNQNEVGVDCGGVCSPCANGGCQTNYEIVKNDIINYHIECQNGKTVKCCDVLNTLINNIKRFCVSPESLGLSDFLFYRTTYGCAGAVPNWELNTLYRIADRVLFAGAVYECLQTHSSNIGWEPSVAVSLWRKIN